MTTDLIHQLGKVVAGEVSTSKLRRAEYSSDASNYRVVPQAVVIPRTVDDIVAAATVARDAQVPITARGAGTSVAGNAIGPGIIIDTSRWLNRVVSIDPEARQAVVQPGTILDALQAQAAPFGLRFGPDPSTHARCTFGGMIGNNACGPHAVAYGRTADNVVALDVIDGTGRRFIAGNDADGQGVDSVPGLQALVDGNESVIRSELGRFERQVSGYSLEHLLPENGGHLGKALVGSEGTCALVLEATVELVAVPAARTLVVLGYPDMIAAADDVPAVLAHAPLAVEGIDARLVDVVRRHKGPAHVPALPSGAGWLLVEFDGAEQGEADAKARRLASTTAAIDVKIASGEDAIRLWRIRDDGAGLAGRTPAGKQAWPGWEDAAVPPENLGAYLRDFSALCDRSDIDGLLYGHFGDGCVHVRLDLPLADHAELLRPFLIEAAQITAAHGGSLSGEHGDGRARSELLAHMYSPDALAVFASFKALFDPDDLLNPGVIVHPAKVDDHLRRPAAVPVPLPARRGGFAFGEDDFDLTNTLHRCVGIAKCRADTSAAGSVMCPSWLATADETHSPRGRARVLQEMVNGSLVTDGFDSDEVHQALDWCLSCKACSSDCPAGVDIASYKSEVLHHRYRRRLRPRSHYLLGQLPRWLRWATAVSLPVDRLLRQSAVRRAVLRSGALDERRDLPTLASRPWRRVETGARPPAVLGRTQPQVVLWTDSFTDAFCPEIAAAALQILEAAGYEVLLPERPVCCGLTWVTTGQLGGARRRLRRSLDVLGPFADDGIPIVGLEPSCIATLRGDLPELLPDDGRSKLVAEAVATLAEFLRDQPGRASDERWQPPRLDGAPIIAQPHCHHHAVMGFDADLDLLRSCGATVDVVNGCCGMAGNFGMERGNYELSVAIAEQSLLPAITGADEEAILLADGFSCRTQAKHLADVRGVHLAQVLVDRLGDTDVAGNRIRG